MSDFFNAVVAEIDAIPGIQCSDSRLSTRLVKMQTQGFLISVVYKIDPRFIAPPNSDSLDGFRKMALLEYHPEAGPWIAVTTYNKHLSIRKGGGLPVTTRFDLADPGSVDRMVDLVRGQAFRRVRI